MDFNLAPSSLDDILGQNKLLSKNAALRLLIENRQINFIVFGPPGIGKTSLARLISSQFNIPLLEFNASNFKLDLVKKGLGIYENSLTKALLFIDEIHRLNIAQQDFLLPLLESKQVYFIGASSENPFFTLNNALRSRVLIFEFKALTSDDCKILFDRAIKKYPFKNIKNTELIRDYLVQSCGGDCRMFIKLFETASIFESRLDSKNTEEDVLKMLENITKNHQGVKQKDTHFDLISAFIKSIRGSDVNAAIFYLSRLIKAGESPEFIARRLVILASEDIGNANPNALNLSVSTMQGVSKIGYPEARILLAQCTIYLCCCPKSNSAYSSINKALACEDDFKVPEHLKTHSKNYKYPHDFDGYVSQFYYAGKEFVKLGIGFEKTLQDWLEKIKNNN